MDTATFFTRILPRGGNKLLAELVPYIDAATGETKTSWRYNKFDSFDQMAEAVAQYESQGKTVYHACNAYGDWYEDQATGKKRIRTTLNVTHCRSLYEDIDTGKDTGYATAKEAMTAVREFIKVTELPTPLVVYSGGGIHLYWPMTEDVTPDEWRHMATLKRRLTMHLGLRVDRAVDTDLARVLRPVGSTNRKYKEARTVVAKNDPAATPPATLGQLLSAAVDRLHAPLAPAGKPHVANAFGAALENNYPDSYADVVAQHCATVRWFKDTGAPNEPLWHKCVGALKHCVDGAENIHAWSARYSNYSREETQAKIDQWGFGPASCEVIKSCEGNRCHECPSTGKITSPVQLGHIVETTPVDLSKVREDSTPAPTMSDEELVKIVWAEGVSARDDGLYKAIKDEDDVVKHHRFSRTVFYVVGLVKNEDGEWELEVEYVAQHGEKRRFGIPTSHLAAMDKMAGTLAAHTIFIEHKNGRTWAMDQLKAGAIALQSHRIEVTTEEAFGWTPTGAGFIIGGTELREDGEKPVRLSEKVISASMAGDYGVSGTRANWVRLVDEIYNRPGAELYQFAFLVAAASPLIDMVGIDGFHGIPVAYTGEDGRGKTTVCELACSIWGKGEMFKQSSNKGGTTVNALLARTAIFRHLPWVMDELTGQKTEEISDMLYALSNGQGKARLNAAGHFVSGASRWDLFSFVTGNMDITGLLSNLDRQMAEAVSVRCFEIKVPDDINETVFKGVNVKQLIDVELRQNYGVVGRELMRLFMKNRAKIVALVHKLRQEYNPRTADETRERFYVDLICFAIAAGKVLKARDLIRFDIEAIRKWAFGNIKSLRRARTERQYTHDDMAGSFISSLHDCTIVTKTIVDGRRGNSLEVPLETLRGEPIARKATADRRYYVAAKAFQQWGKENNVSPSVLRNTLDAHGYIVHATGRDSSGGFNFRLGQGTTRTTGLCRVYELDFDRIHGFEKDTQDGKVVPITAAGTKTVTTTDTGSTSATLTA